MNRHVSHVVTAKSFSTNTIFLKACRDLSTKQIFLTSFSVRLFICLSVCLFCLWENPIRKKHIHAARRLPLDKRKRQSHPQCTSLIIIFITRIDCYSQHSSKFLCVQQTGNPGYILSSFENVPKRLSDRKTSRKNWGCNRFLLETSLSHLKCHALASCLHDNPISKRLL